MKNGYNSAPAGSDSGIYCEHLWKVFPSPDGPVRALCDVTCEIPRGTLAWIQGASGSGKSTLLSLLGALERPTKGGVYVFGKELNALTGECASAFRRHQVGYLISDLALVPHLSGIENVALSLMFDGLPATEIQARALAQLEAFDVSHRARHRPNQMSLGERVRVTLARALVRNPPLLLADEPTANLDAENAERVISLLQSLSIDGTTVVVASHDDRFQKVSKLNLHLSHGKFT
uniref:Putative ABC transport system ATP-binding protein n=1 Tax=Candidatus Kentrum sp. LPFa TaxID=2126335 RepID=A0A450XEU7_9GAMM|nr:MAG: putative ABC transport system ATP-binding protein [Candidatus Kentron sp. LPFa]